jgi:hypothetical protein
VAIAAITLIATGGFAKLPLGDFLVNGKVADPLHLTVADLASLPIQTLTVSFKAGTQTETHTYTGPLLLDVVNLAQPNFNARVKNDKLRFYVSAMGADGYKVIVAWGEIDPGFENKQVLLAITEDGRSLETEGPRLVVPGDDHGGRYVTNVVRIHVDRGQ